MFSTGSLISLTLAALAVTSNAAPASQVQSCFPPTPGNYSIQSVAFTGELLNLGQPDANGFTIVMEKAPPMGNLGTWTLSAADQGGYTILNVEEGRNVTTIQVADSSVVQPQLPVPGTPGSTYAIECAGIGLYNIRAVDADSLWTSVPGTGLGDMQQGVARVQMLPADGSDEQQFILNAL